MPVTLCLDPGAAHTGIAVSLEGIIASPVATIFERDLDRLVGRLIPYLVRFGPDKVIIGTPEHGPLVELGKKLKEKLSKVYLGEVDFFSEDLSSSQARTVLKDSRKTIFSRKKEEHQTAAAIILQNYLDSR